MVKERASGLQRDSVPYTVEIRPLDFEALSLSFYRFMNKTEMEIDNLHKKCLFKNVHRKTFWVVRCLELQIE